MQVPEAISDSRSRGSPALQQNSNEWEDIRGSVASPPLEPKKARNLQRGSVFTQSAGRRGRRPSLTSRTLRNNQRQWQESHTSGLLETAEMSTRDQTRLVLSGQPTGWTAMARSVRDFDEEKVRDCKEDIDTLLVFAGLFSAVLTAFLVESYKNLVEDPTTQTLLAIRQLVSQTSSYRVEGGMLNTTVLPYSPEPFQVSRADIRVNVLWFASLLFSLITASFGILVKQWLREFLAVENPSPQARLRVRHVRYPQLAQWRVFQIAAVLPLLLQLSLALFFVGLCYFTASVHSSVEYTALPLVLGWTVCFCTVMVLPVFLPRCPYRTALLRNLIQHLHRAAGRAANRVANTCLEALALPTPPSRWREVWLTRVEAMCAKISTLLAEQDEAQIVRRAENDIEILESVDSIQSDDELLGTAIAEAVDHVRCSPSQFESFLQRIFENRGYSARHAVIISNRTHRQVTRPFPLPILDLRRISKQARNAICTIVSHYASTTRLDAGPVIGAWTIDLEAYRMIFVCMIMLAVSDCPLPEDGLYILRGPRFRSRGYRMTSHLLGSALLTRNDPRDQEHDIPENRAFLLLCGLSKLWQHLDSGTDSLLKTVFYATTECGDLGIDELSVHPLRVDDWHLDHLSAGQKAGFMGLLLDGTAGILCKERGTYTGVDFNLRLTLRAILRLSYSAGKYSFGPYGVTTFDFILNVLLSDIDLTLSLVDALLQAPLSWVYMFNVRFLDRFDSSPDPVYGIDMRAYDWCAGLDKYIEGVASKLADTENPISSTDALKFCYFATALARLLIPVQPPKDQWATLFSILLGRIETPCDDQSQLSKAKVAIADHMLNMIFLAEKPQNERAWSATADGDEELYAAWADSWQDGDGLFPDALLQSVAPYAPESRLSKRWRARRAIEVVRANQLVTLKPQVSSAIDDVDEWRDVPVIHYSDYTTGSPAFVNIQATAPTSSRMPVSALVGSEVQPVPTV